MPRCAVGLVFLLLSACAPTTSRVPIYFTTPGDGSGEIGGMIVPVEYRGRAGTLAIDTGSALTFLYLGKDGPRFKRDVGEVRIGSETLMLPGRNLEADDETEANIVGVLGADFLIDVPTEFDPGAGRITRYLSGAPDIRGLDAWTALPFEDVEGHIIITLNVDGRDRRLMWDTGSPHILLIGEQKKEGDRVSRAADVEGTQFPIYVGPSAVVIPGEGSRTLTVLRAPSFPYFEGTVEALGGNIDGLAGQSVFSKRRLVFDPAAGVIRLGPALK